MNKYNPNIHHRRSIRLKGYDYSQAGFYFLTICCQKREYFYGNIANHKMILNDAGIMITKWYKELEHKFLDIKCHEMVVMPNHFHCIIENVGADLRVCPLNERTTLGEHTTLNHPTILGEHTTLNHPTILGEHTTLNHPTILGEHTTLNHPTILGEHIGSPLHWVVQWFKTMSTNEYIRGVKTKKWKRFDRRLWQRNYWEHIIRDENEYLKISDYIKNNPAKWEDDCLHAGNKNCVGEPSASYNLEQWMV